MSEAVKAQYRTLHELKRIDEKVHRLQNDLVKIPEEIGRFDQALLSQRKSLDNAKDLLEGVEKRLRQAEQDLREKDDFIKKAESKMMEVKTNEEYQAAIKENEGHKKEKAKLEEANLTLLNDAETKRKQYKDSEAQFKEYETKLHGEKKTLEAERAKLVNQLESHLQQRQQTATQLDRGILAIYERLNGRGRGAAIVRADKGMCMGCNMRIRPQLYNEVIGFKHVHQCPSCGKILVPELPAEAGGEASGETPSP